MISSASTPVLKNQVQEALKALEEGPEAEVVHALTALHRVIEHGIPDLPVTAAFSQLLEEAIALLDQTVNKPSPPLDLPANLKSYQTLGDLYADLIDLRQFILAIVKGDLNRQLRLKGYLAGGLKALQANLRHLTWQTQMIAAGDFSQRVDFMGDFSTAFNAMVSQLDASLQQIKNNEADLTRINMELRQEIELRKKTEESLRKSEERYHKLAITDPLTGIYNRRHFFHLAKVELQRACRHRRPLAVIMLDIDEFKKINDSHGHAVGDRVLQVLARLILNALRSIDIFARYGGEEFILLLPETDLQAASAIAERLRGQVAGTPLLDGETHLNITISLGASVLEPSAELAAAEPGTLDQLIGSADQALYEAKNSGRNRVCMFNGKAS